MSDPIILAGTTGENAERRYVQFWGTVKVAGLSSIGCLASMSNTDSQILGIDLSCPAEWFPAIFAAFRKTIANQPVEPTHTVEWNFSKPTFTAITPDVAAPLFEIEEAIS